MRSLDYDSVREFFTGTYGTPRLPIMFHPTRHESLISYVRRLATSNGMKPSGLRRLMGVRQLTRTNDEQNWRVLADWLGLPPESFDANRPRTIQTKTSKCKFTKQLTADAHVGLGLISFAPRICPKCVQANLPMPQTWSFSFYAACLTHGLRLLDACTSCGKDLKRWIAGYEACTCGTVYGDMDPYPAPTASLLVARNLQSLCDAGDISSEPPKLDGVSAELGRPGVHDYMSLIRTFGIAARPASADRPLSIGKMNYKVVSSYGNESVREAEKRIQAAEEYLCNWPRGFDDLLKSVVHRNKDARGGTALKRAFATESGRLLAYPLPDYTGRPLSAIAIASRAFVKRAGLGVQCRPTVSSKVEMRIFGKVTRADVQARSGINRYELIQRVVDHVVAMLESGDLSLSDDDLARLVSDRSVTILNKSRELVSIERAMAAIEGVGCKLSPAGIRAWLQPDLLVQDADASVLWDVPPRRIHPDNISNLLGKLATVAVFTTDGELVSPTDRRFGNTQLRTWYSKTDLIRDVLNGKVTAYSRVTKPLWKDLFFRPADLERRRARVRAEIAPDPYQFCSAAIKTAGEAVGKELISSETLRTLARTSDVRKEARGHQSCDRTSNHRLVYRYHTADLIAAAERWLSGR